ncbi:hypothetical protein DES36_101202 [Alkalibaculum bacchi]|uniref:Uncharacterized protein n=1 Tax=Alkalibaculum bacchi TaxID=645887 RepID=A0A366IG72_9FIRM|nr:hypothetical protein [Alkalibaculum bacchi]RBP70147.1 hypothetical protein DES36_101202 [Alkalibaculum bacchi]
MEENTNYSTNNNEINYSPEFVNIEGLQGVNSSQGMENFMQDMNNFGPMYGMDETSINSDVWSVDDGMDNMYNMPPMQGGMDSMYNMPPMQGGMDSMYNMPPMQGGMDSMYNMPPMQGGMDNMYNMPPMQGMNGYNIMPMGGTCTEVIRCVASMCYMASVFFMQMLQNSNGYDMGMYQNPMYQSPMGGCGCSNCTQDDNYGYPPIY